MMLRFVLVGLLSGAFAVGLDGQDGTNATPKLWLMLPGHMPSENVQIDYFMTGPFGGYGESVRLEKQRNGYEIEAAVEGRPAEKVKLIAYLRGCEIVTLVIPVKGETSKHQLPCKQIPSIPFRGQIFPVSRTQEQPAEVEVHYAASWSHNFFGIKDGAVTTFRLGSAVPDRDGKSLSNFRPFLDKM